MIDDAYTDPRFNTSVDQRTGYRTRNIVCVPVRTMAGEIIGVMQSLNKHEGDFSRDDLELLAEMTSQATIALQSLQYVEQIDQHPHQGNGVPRDGLGNQLRGRSDARCSARGGAKRRGCSRPSARRSSSTTRRPTRCFRCVGQRQEVNEIRFPSQRRASRAPCSPAGRASTFRYAYADLRFNPAFDRQTGFFTRCILCVPIVNKHGEVIGVTQVLNKKGGVFTDKDEQQLEDLHRADRHRARKLQAVRRRAADEAVQ